MDVLLAAAECVRLREIETLRARRGKIQKLHVKRKRGVFRCDKCASIFGLRHNLLRHQRTIHQRRRALPCDNDGCDAMFGTRAQLLKHRRSSHCEQRANWRAMAAPREAQQRAERAPSAGSVLLARSAPSARRID